MPTDTGYMALDESKNPELCGSLYKKPLEADLGKLISTYCVLASVEYGGRTVCHTAGAEKRKFFNKLLGRPQPEGGVQG